MPFIRVPGITGKVYMPESPAGEHSKHLCTDCFACQWCSDERCRACRQPCGDCGGDCDGTGKCRSNRNEDPCSDSLVKSRHRTAL
ncbi:MAG: hypothetical protein C4548_01900 [Desulfobacteraceae bacterium]|nr:MAG: hypothetical protein C4548_01900 [Desulfobacteraceae bacterium]